MKAATQMCAQCGIGPFFWSPGRPYPMLCLDCAEAPKKHFRCQGCTDVGTDTVRTARAMKGHAAFFGHKAWNAVK